MPFNGSGTYVPPGSPTFPPTPGSVISSTYFTTTINDLGSALSLTFLRDGSLPLGGNLNFGGNKIAALGAGAVGALAVNFNDDATTGLFLNGVGNLNLVTGGTTRVAISSAGIAITGTLSATGAITQAGNQVWHAGNFNPASYAPLANPTFTTRVIINSAGSEQISLIGSATPFIAGYNGAGTVRQGFLQFTAGPTQLGSDTGTVVISALGVNTVLIASNGVNVTGTLNSTGALTQNSNQVWHAGNFNPALYATVALYAPLASPAFTGTVTINGTPPGTREISQTAKSAAFAFDTTMLGGHVYYTGAAAAATISTNATTAMPIGSAIVVVNNGSGALTLTRVGGVSLNWNGTDANRTLAVGGMATLLKVATDTWFVSGTLLS